jgi:hypothetical protein
MRKELSDKRVGNGSQRSLVRTGNRRVVANFSRIATSAGWPMTYSKRMTGNAVTFAAPCALGFEAPPPAPNVARLDLPENGKQQFTRTVASVALLLFRFLQILC